MQNSRYGQVVYYGTDPIQSPVIRTQSQLSRSSVKTEGEDCGSLSDSTRHLREEIQRLKSELERRPNPEEVSIIVVHCLPPQCGLGCSKEEAQEEQAAYARTSKVPFSLTPPLLFLRIASHPGTKPTTSGRPVVGGA